MPGLDVHNEEDVEDAEAGVSLVDIMIIELPGQEGTIELPPG